MKEVGTPDGWIYENENNGDVVQYGRRNPRLDRLANWTLIGQPDPETEISREPEILEEDQRMLTPPLTRGPQRATAKKAPSRSGKSADKARTSG